MIKVITQYVAECDVCKTRPRQALSRNEIVYVIDTEGWDRKATGETICPLCREKGGLRDAVA
jgi:hypothetical protein